MDEEGASGIDVRFGFPLWLRPFIASGVAAITIGSRVYLDPGVVSLPESRVLAILSHEIEHVNQYRRHGLAGFLARYAFEYARNRARGLSRYRAYREIGFEKEAFAAERHAERSGHV
jgi:hypothetical protein